jgi:uncharacterized membrane protein
VTLLPRTFHKGWPTMHPLDIKTVLLAKHAQHIVLIHFPIALFLSAVVFDLIAQRTKRVSLADTAYYNLIGAALFTLPVITTGFLAWHFQLEGQRFKGILLMHVVLACVSTVVIWVALWIHFRSRRGTGRLPKSRFVIELVGAAVIALTAHLGGFLSGVNGMS